MCPHIVIFILSLTIKRKVDSENKEVASFGFEVVSLIHVLFVPNRQCIMPYLFKIYL